ncbi:hypothetical protein HZS61_015553 [Fusarium oxysporum f. sp. conglutinans]|uniref:DUF6699 domain-containing protein n=1 Tax=Fusarium oxysporum f. sp. conglutinans TaxID=100902 RepID=A0A8H6GQ70_FUSOX|nr:hypothetical protein HZS61_015553 [Fusarium oxysporum f. sp. conglutinans]
MDDAEWQVRLAQQQSNLTYNLLLLTQKQNQLSNQILSINHITTTQNDGTSLQAAPGVYNVNDLEAEGIELELAPETQKTGWKINTSPNTIEDPAILKLHLSKPPVKRIDLHFPLGKEVTARNLKGVTIKDALDAIHKAYKKRADDELDKPYLAGFEWDKEESWTQLVVHLQAQPTSTTLGGPSGGGKKKKNKKQDE